MKLLIVDLYGDGDSLRVCEDTEANRAAVLAFAEADKKYALNVDDLDAADPPNFTDFVEARGVVLFTTDRISFDP